MKKITTTAGLLALGAASLHAIYAPELSRIETGKPWTVAASLRGFYDDNVNTSPSWRGVVGSWGFEARPYLGVNLPMEQSYLGFSYLNSSRFYEARNTSGADPWDFDHQFTVKFDHQFSPRYRLKVNDVFTYGVLPDTTGIVTFPFYRSDLSYFRNLGQVYFTGELTKTLGFSIAYNNTFYEYQDSPSVPGSYSSVLNRIEQYVPVDFRWQVQPDLVTLIGYQYGRVDYTGDGLISTLPPLSSDSRNMQSHTMYLGADYDLTAQLRASLRAGAMYTTYQDYGDSDQWTPYVDFVLDYFYTAGSHVDVGFRHTVAPTDVYQPASGMPTLSQEASAVYARINHQFTPKLTGNLLVQYQWSTFYGGLYGDQSENLLGLTLYLAYQINQFLSVEGGYSYNWLDSDLRDGDGRPIRSYNQNIFFLGLRAQY